MANNPKDISTVNHVTLLLTSLNKATTALGPIQNLDTDLK